MRIAQFNGRAHIVTNEGLIDVAAATHGSYSHDIDKVLPRLPSLEKWFLGAKPVPTLRLSPQDLIGDQRLGPPVAHPGQILGVGANYHSHAEEMGLAVPSEPMVFAKFVSSLGPPNAPVKLPRDTTDYESELVLVVGSGGRHLTPETAMDALAGYCVGQDLSERTVQMAGRTPQFSLGKSYQGFAPVGPWLTTTSEIANPHDLTISCFLNGEEMQHSSTGDMVFSVRDILVAISTVIELRCGDLIFTGSPAGVGQGRRPPRFLSAGDKLETSIEGLGTIVQTFE